MYKAFFRCRSSRAANADLQSTEFFSRSGADAFKAMLFFVACKALSARIKAKECHHAEWVAVSPKHGKRKFLFADDEYSVGR